MIFLKTRIIILIILSLIFLFVNKISFKNEKNDLYIKSFENYESPAEEKENTKIITEKIISSEDIIEKLSIERNNFSIVSVEENFSVKYESLSVKDYRKEENFICDTVLPDNIFEKYSLDVYEIWDIKDRFNNYTYLKFAGKMKKNDIYYGLIYFENNLMYVKEKDFLGDMEIIKIFSDGMLLMSSDNEFLVVI